MGCLVLLRGLLKGMSREVECEVIVRKSPIGTTTEAGFVPTYLDCKILTAPVDLPDGEYTVHLDSQVIPVVRRRGQWL
jgi:hypothetical protein